MSEAAIHVRITDMPGPSVLDRAAVIKKKIAELKPHALECDDGSMAPWAVMEGLKELDNEIDLLITAATPAPKPPEEPSPQRDWVNEQLEGSNGS